MSRLLWVIRCAWHAAWTSAWCEVRGHEYHALYAGGRPLADPPRLPTVRMRQCIRCGDFGGFSRTGWGDPS